MGLAQAMHHEAIGRIAHQVLAVADGVDGGPSRGGKNAAFELHLISSADLTVVGTCPHNSEVSTGDEMEFKSRIFATSRGSTIDAIGDGKYLVCNPAYCFMVHGLRQAHEAVQRQEKPAL